jgi:Holliday junction resolvase RusA-like endonuclease
LKEIELTIPGPPRGKGRPRFRRAGKYVQTYSPDQTVSYENLIKLLWIEKQHEKLSGALELVITAFFPIPKSKSKKQQEAMSSGQVRPTVKIDVDNLAKIVMDGLQGIAFDDDKQIVSLKADKWYSDTPRTEVTIKEIQ